MLASTKLGVVDKTGQRVDYKLSPIYIYVFFMGVDKFWAVFFCWFWCFETCSNLCSFCLLPQKPRMLARGKWWFRLRSLAKNIMSSMSWRLHPGGVDLIHPVSILKQSRYCTNSSSSSSSPQIQWLEKDLQSFSRTTTPFLVVTCHEDVDTVAKGSWVEFRSQRCRKTDLKKSLQLCRIFVDASMSENPHPRPQDKLWYPFDIWSPW